MDYPFTEMASAEIAATPEQLFAHLDDHERLAAHMEKRSAMMMGGHMTYAFDDTGGRAVGSVIRMGGSVLGVTLEVEEVVTERIPPRRKVWETVGRPRLLIIGAYRMGFDIEPKGGGSTVRVFIDYRHPTSLAGRVLGRLFARAYARWCVERMAQDAVHAGKARAG
ncbi:MAG TPA: SRPBCC family protein [Azospirillum sp.]